MKKNISENDLSKLISESIAKHMMNEIDDDQYEDSLENDLNFLSNDSDANNDVFNQMSDTEFNGNFEDDDDAELHKDLIELMIEGEKIFKEMREIIETSSKYSNENEKLKGYVNKLDQITDIIEGFWY